MKQRDVEIIESILLGIFLCLFKLICAPKLGAFWCIFPLVGLPLVRHILRSVGDQQPMPADKEGRQQPKRKGV